jgi:hypothetical protein
MQGKFIIELNKVQFFLNQSTTDTTHVFLQTFSVFQRVTTSNNNEVPSKESPFMSASSFLHFNADRIEFEVKINMTRTFTIDSKTICYEVFHRSLTTEKSHRELPILHDGFEEKSDSTFLKVHGGFRDELLNLFGPQKKEFKLVVNYKEKNRQKFQAVFTVLMPNITPQK